jgi:hypothetical protein
MRNAGWKAAGAAALLVLGGLAAAEEGAKSALPEAASQASAADLLAWPRMRADRFGCYLEKAFGHRDPRFNCALKRYVNKGDPCKNTKAYYDGPKFPDALKAKLHPSVRAVELSWEHGDLREVSITLGGELPEPAARALLKLPPKGAPLPEHVQDVRVEACGKGVTCVSLTGFDHQGAGDVDCGD